MTPGQLALAEAARLESALVYGRLCPEHKAVDDGAETEPRNKVNRLIGAVRIGMTNNEIMAQYHVCYATVRAARKAAMADVA